MQSTPFLLIAFLLNLTLAGVAADEVEIAGAAVEARVSTRAIITQLKQAGEYVTLGEPDAALVKYEQLLTKHGKGPSRFVIRLHLGHFFFQQGQFEKAMEHFARAAADGSGRGEQNPDGEGRVEALFHIGMCYVRLGQDERSFPSFRQVIELAPGSELANQAYFQIGEAHYTKTNFTQAIANYILVGTSLGETQLASRRAELGKPLFIRIQDKDFLVMEGKPVSVAITTGDGDREIVTLRPLRPGSDTYVGSISTGLGAPTPGDDLITATGTSVVTMAYADSHTADGELDVARLGELSFVGDGRTAVTDGAFRDPISQVIVDQGAGNLNLRVIDFDQDTGDTIDTIQVEIVVERPLPKDELAKDDGEEPAWEERARTTVTLSESPVAKRGDVAPPAGGPLRSGSFTLVHPIASDGRAGTLAVAIGDRITATYRDVRHLAADTPALREARCLVVPGSTSNLQVAGTSLDDANLKVRKELLQAETAMRIGEVYRDMGLEVHAQSRLDEALAACSRVSGIAGTYDRELHEQTLYTLWRIFLAKGALDEAARACQTLQVEFPDSDYIADSLMALAKAADLAGQPAKAVQIYQQIASLPKGSVLMPEALYCVGLVYERQIERLSNGQVSKDGTMRQQAINAFRSVFVAYPDSSFAGDALKKIGDLYLEDGNWSQAIEFFEQILREYPDAPFIADVLYNLGVSRGQKGAYAEALESFARLEREYPGYERMEKAHTFRQGIAKKMAAKNTKRVQTGDAGKAGDAAKADDATKGSE